MSFVWSSLYKSILAPSLLAAFRLTGFLGNKKIKQGLAMRDEVDGARPWCKGEKNTRPIWIHCASGELEYAKPVIQELKRRLPTQKILVSYFSPSIKNAVERFPGIDISTPSPFENEDDLQALIDYHKPRALLIARTDTWPLMLSTASKNQIPSLLFSATLSDAAGRLHPLMRSLSKHVFSFLTQIFCVTEDDRRHFSELGFGEKTKVAGDTRFDQVIARLKNPKPITESIFGNLPKEKIFVAGSTWGEDEARLLPVIKAFKDQIRFVIAPHEPTLEHLASLESKLALLDLKSTRYSKYLGENADVILIDQVGILAELYAHSSYAFVGGSFRKTVHSVMEPLGAGCFTFIGPLHLNNREAIEFKTIHLPGNRGLSCALEIRDSADWIDILKKTFNSIQPSEDRAFIQAQITQRAGKSALVADWVTSSVLGQNR